MMLKGTCLLAVEIDAVLKSTKVVNNTPYPRLPRRSFAWPIKSKRSTWSAGKVQKWRSEDLGRHGRRKSVSVSAVVPLPPATSLPDTEGWTCHPLTSLSTTMFPPARKITFIEWVGRRGRVALESR